ncbi:MAG: metal-dependent hydrolase [Hydrogenophaga sp.]
MDSVCALGYPPSSPYWNQSPALSLWFDALSLILPAGEAFVIDAVADAARRLPVDAPLRTECDRFVREELSHQRAHRLYNQRMAIHGRPVAQIENRFAGELRQLWQRLSPQERLLMAAALECITAQVSRSVLRGRHWLTDAQNAQTRLWRWHCAQELEHVDVPMQLLQLQASGYRARVTWYAMASVALVFDLVRTTAALYRSDVAHGHVKPRTFAWSAVCAGTLLMPSMLSLTAHWLSCFLPLRGPAKESVGSATRVRRLVPADLPALLALEAHCWLPHQAAAPEQMLERMQRYPDLCWGAFCGQSGQALASLFMKPTTEQAMWEAKDWNDCVNTDAPSGPDAQKALFGISLSSRDPNAVKRLFAHFWPHAVKAGWRHVYLGSPVPGFAAWRRRYPDAPAADYAKSMRGGKPVDPQLRYYHAKGFRETVRVLPAYFPHAPSLDHGVILRASVPGARWKFLWRRLPWTWLERLGRQAVRLG